MRFRKKPVVIEAVQFMGIRDGLVTVEGLSSLGDAGVMMPWLSEALNRSESESGSIAPHIDGTHALIRTLEGVMSVAPDDWIICGVKGEIYPCKPDIFAATYDAA